MSGPLHGYKVIELTSTVSGPIAGMILGDQGADIIKIEPPMVGDLARHMGDSRNGMAAMFSTLNRNKRSLVLDLKDSADMDIFLQLIPSADVLIENYRPGIVKKLGIDYDTLKALNPGLVYASISGYGQSGPYRHRKVYDPLIQATTGTAFEQHGVRPTNVRTIIFDKVTGYTAAQSITAALLQRARTGEGQHLPISMLGSALYFQWPDVMWSHTFQGEGTRPGGTLADWFQIFKTADGFASIVLVASESFERLCLLLDLDLHLDERFRSLPDRLANADVLQELLDEAMSTWTTEARLTRAEFLKIREREFVTSSRAMGAGNLRIISRVILPNAMPPLVVAITLRVGITIIYEAALSFLGLTDPDVMTWGKMIGLSRDFFFDAWWTVTFPGVAILVVVLCIALIGDGLNDAFNPKLRGR